MLSFVAMKKWKIYANANNTCVEFLKCSGVQMRIIDVRAAKLNNIMTTFQKWVFYVSTFLLYNYGYVIII